MIPTPKIRAFGKLQIWDQNGNLVRLTTKKTELLLATLLLASIPKSRKELSEEIWSDAPPEKARLSLRTALAQIRKELGQDVLISDSNSVELDRNAVESDFIQALRLRRLLTINKDSFDRRKFQIQLIDLTIHPLFDGLNGDQIESERLQWQGLRKSLLHELSDDYLMTNQVENALGAASQALNIDPLDEISIAKQMTIFAQSGRVQEALKLSQDSARLFKRELNISLPKLLIDLTATIKTGRLPPGPQIHTVFNESIEKELLASIIESTISKDPDSVLNIICNESFNPMAVENLKSYLDILESVLHQTKGNSEPRIRAARMAARTAMMLSDFPKCFEWGRVVVENTEESSQLHIATLDFLSAAYFHTQDYGLAEELSIKARHLAEKFNFPIERNTIIGNFVLYHIHQLKFETAISNAELTLDLILQENASPFRICSAYSLLAGCHLALENYESAIEFADKGISIIKGSPYYLNGSNYCLKAVAQVKTNRPKLALQSAIEGLCICYAGNSQNVVFSGLELSCQVLTEIGNTVPAIWISDATNQLRVKNSVPRTPLILQAMSDQNLSPNTKILAQARASNRLLNESAATIVEFTLSELERALRNY